MTEEYDKRGNDSWLAMEKYGDLVGRHMYPLIVVIAMKYSWVGVK